MKTDKLIQSKTCPKNEIRGIENVAMLFINFISSWMQKYSNITKNKITIFALEHKYVLGG